MDSITKDKKQKITDGKVYYEGNDLTSMSHKELRAMCGQVQTIFQYPYSSLKPRITNKSQGLTS